MPHPDAEHGLRVQLATALRERDEALAQETYWHNRASEARADLEVANAKADAAESERDALRARAEKAEVERDHLRAATANANKQTADLNASRLKLDAELVSTREALAAARRECEGLTMLLRNEMERLHYVAAPGPEEEDVDLCAWCSNAWPCEDADCFVFKVRKALAAPADDAPDTSPAALEAWEKRLRREAEVSDPNLAAPAASEEKSNV